MDKIDINKKRLAVFAGKTFFKDIEKAHDGKHYDRFYYISDRQDFDNHGRPVEHSFITTDTRHGYAIKDFLHQEKKIEPVFLMHRDDYNPKMLTAYKKRLQKLDLEIFERHFKVYNNKATAIEHITNEFGVNKEEILYIDDNITKEDEDFIKEIGNTVHITPEKSKSKNILTAGDFRNFADDQGWFFQEDWEPIEFFSNYRYSMYDNIHIVAIDIDGTSADSLFRFSQEGHRIKKFSVVDKHALQNLKYLTKNRACIIPCWITSDKTSISHKYVTDIGYHPAQNLFQGEKDETKMKKLLDLMKAYGVRPENVSYIGDDGHCSVLLQQIIHMGGRGFAPADATKIIRDIPKIEVLKHNGGDGAVAEMVNTIKTDNHIHDVTLYPLYEKVE